MLVTNKMSSYCLKPGSIHIASFFVGGQEIRKILLKQNMIIEDIVIPSEEEVILGTKRTQFVFLVRAFFILIGIEGIKG